MQLHQNSDLWLFHSICKHARHKNVEHNSANFSKWNVVVIKNVFLISFKVTTNWGFYKLDFIIVFQTASFEVSCCHNRNDSTFLFFKMLMWWCHTFCVLLKKYYYLGFCSIFYRLGIFRHLALLKVIYQILVFHWLTICFIVHYTL